MHLVAAFAVNDHASAEKADAGNDALNDAARRCELVTACSSFKSRDNEPGGAEMKDYYSNYMYSARLRVMYLF